MQDRICKLRADGLGASLNETKMGKAEALTVSSLAKLVIPKLQRLLIKLSCVIIIAEGHA